MGHKVAIISIKFVASSRKLSLPIGIFNISSSNCKQIGCLNAGFFITNRVADQLKSFMICIDATNPRIGLFDNLKERCGGPSGGGNEFKESDFMGGGRADNADVQFKVLFA